MNKAFTLVEMMIAVTVMAVIVMGGTMVFFRTLSSSGVNQSVLNVSASSAQTLLAIENNIRYKKVLSLNASDRAACVVAGANGNSVQGDTLKVYDDYGTTTYSLSANNIASDSGSGVITINSPNLNVNSLLFEWMCTPGTYDKIRVTINTNDVNLPGSQGRVFSREINMYNSN